MSRAGPVCNSCLALSVDSFSFSFAFFEHVIPDFVAIYKLTRDQVSYFSKQSIKASASLLLAFENKIMSSAYMI